MAARLGGANIPCGVWKYENRVLGVQPYCIVEETRGDRRFGTHVLAGLELLLPTLVKGLPSFDELAAAALPSRPLRDFCGDIYSTGEIMLDVALGGLAFPGLKVPDCFASLCDSKLLPVVAPSANVEPEQWTAAGPVPLQAKWRNIWKAKCDQLANSPNLDIVLPYLYSRCGFEGEFRSIGTSFVIFCSVVPFSGDDFAVHA